MSKWQVHVHVDDEDTARNMVEELNGEGFGVSLYKSEIRERCVSILQYTLLPTKERSGTTQGED